MQPAARSGIPATSNCALYSCSFDGRNGTIPQEQAARLFSFCAHMCTSPVVLGCRTRPDQGFGVLSRVLVWGRGGAPFWRFRVYFGLKRWYALIGLGRVGTLGDSLGSALCAEVAVAGGRRAAGAGGGSIEGAGAVHSRQKAPQQRRPLATPRGAHRED